MNESTSLNCDCGGIYKLGNKGKHFKTNKHKEFYCIEIQYIECECKGKYSPYLKNYHLATKTHSNFLLHQELQKMKGKAVFKQLKKDVPKTHWSCKSYH